MMTTDETDVELLTSPSEGQSVSEVPAESSSDAAEGLEVDSPPPGGSDRRGSFIGKNLVWLFVSQVLTWAVTIVVVTKIPDALGDTAFGTFSYAVGLSRFVALGAALCNSTFLTREVARNRSFGHGWVFNAVLMKIVLTVGLSALVMMIAVALGNSSETLLLILLACAGLLFMGPGEVFVASLAGVERIAKPAMWLVVQVYVQGFVALALVAVLEGGVVAYGAVIAFSALIPTVACGVMIWPHVRGQLHFDWQVWKWLAAGGVPLLALSTFTLIYSAIDIPILHQIAGSDDVGWYALSQRWVGIPIFATTAVLGAFFPAISAHGKELASEFVSLVNRALRLVVFLTVPGAVGIALVARDLLTYFYGHEFDESVPVMQILAINVPLASIGTVLAAALVAADRTRRFLVVAVGAAVFNPVGCLVVINVTKDAFGNGAIGAAIMTVFTEMLIVVGALRLRPTGVLGRATVANFGRVLAASAAMVPVVLLLGTGSLFVKVAVAVVTFGIAAILFRAVSIGELRRVRAHVSGTLGNQLARSAETQ
jgi:O-antigen/teichoic acid export membrane protein